MTCRSLSALLCATLCIVLAGCVPQDRKIDTKRRFETRAVGGPRPPATAAWSDTKPWRDTAPSRWQESPVERRIADLEKQVAALSKEVTALRGKPAAKTEWKVISLKNASANDLTK